MGFAASLLLAIGTVVYGVGRDRDAVGPFADAVAERPLSIAQEGRTTRLRFTTCPYEPDDDLRDDCGPRLYPLQRRTEDFDPSRPFEVRFSSVTRVDAVAGTRADGRFRRLGGWIDEVQCIDSACASSLRFPPGRNEQQRLGRFPERADTLRVIVYSEPLRAFDIALAP